MMNSKARRAAVVILDASGHVITKEPTIVRIESGTRPTRPSIELDPLPPGQVWGISPGGPDSGPSLYRLEVTAAVATASRY